MFLFNNITWTRYVNSKGEHVRAAEAIDSSTQYAEGTYGLKEGYTQETVTGTDFQKKVWRQLCKIEYAHTSTYKEIAQFVGCNSARAVGNAIGRNPVGIIIPCHRVICHNGSLGGYAAGTDIKLRLLRHEGISL